VRDAVKEGVDLFITGEVHHDVYHEAEENGLSVLAFGHYRSETYGVKALQRLTEKKLGIETVFIDAETGL
jgi:putative NIF3 family GTP cyclohydrolase 1 type 2